MAGESAGGAGLAAGGCAFGGSTAFAAAGAGFAGSTFGVGMDTVLLCAAGLSFIRPDRVSVNFFSRSESMPFFAGSAAFTGSAGRCVSTGFEGACGGSEATGNSTRVAAGSGGAANPGFVINFSDCSSRSTLAMTSVNKILRSKLRAWSSNLSESHSVAGDSGVGGRGRFCTEQVQRRPVWVSVWTCQGPIRPDDCSSFLSISSLDFGFSLTCFFSPAGFVDACFCGQLSKQCVAVELHCLFIKRFSRCLSWLELQSRYFSARFLKNGNKVRIFDRFFNVFGGAILLYGICPVTFAFVNICDDYDRG